MGRENTEERDRGQTDSQSQPRASDPERGAEDTEKPRNGERQKLRDKDPKRQGHKQELGAGAKTKMVGWEEWR